MVEPFLPGPAGIWDGEWCVVAATSITCHDIDLWPCSVSVLVKSVTFLATLHWPQGGSILGSGVFLLWRCSCCMSSGAGERLDLEKAVPWYRGAGRSISVSAVPLGPGTDIWRSCRYICALLRALVALPGSIRRFVPCEVGANHCRLRHLGWEKCGHGLTSRPRESASDGFLNELLVFFWLSFWFCCCVVGWGVTPSVLFW